MKNRQNLPITRHISYTSCQDVTEICRSLFSDTDINGFTFQRVYPDGSRALLSTNHKVVEHSYCEKKIFERIYTPEYVPYNQRYILGSDWVNSLPTAKLRKLLSGILQDEQELCGMSYPMYICSKSDDYLEYATFFVSSDNLTPVSFYFNNLERLENFYKFFTKQASTLISEAEEQKVILPWRNEKEVTCHVSEKTYSRMRYKKIANQWLTYRECQCLYYVLQGYSSKMIASKFDLSVRTVESYIDKIKSKLGCYRKSDLFAVCISEKILQIHE